jgi:pheromone shutdown protein TraB
LRSAAPMKKMNIYICTAVLRCYGYKSPFFSPRVQDSFSEWFVWGCVVLNSALVLVYSPRTSVCLAIITSLAVHIEASVIGGGVGTGFVRHRRSRRRLEA